MKDYDDSMDDFDFKPLTKGLGFHHSLQEKTKIKSDLKLKSESLKADLDERAKKLLGSADSVSNLPESNTTHMGELSPFYEKTSDSIKVKDVPRLRDIASSNDTNTEYRYFDAPMTLRLKAWSVDIVVILAMFVFTIGSLFVIADMPFDILAKVMISSDLAPSMMAIFSLFYMLYFSTLDKTTHSTLGKNLFNIKLVGMRSSMTLSMSTMNAFLGLLSVLSMGMLTVLSIPGQISKTRVVQK